MTRPNEPEKNEDFCGNRIGIWAPGSPTCPKLSQINHCQNCERFQERARQLLASPPPENYLEEWSKILTDSKDNTQEYSENVIIFRVCNELLAIPTAHLKEVTRPSTIHRIPHKSDAILLGLTNIRSNLELCFSLQNVLWQQQTPPTSVNTSLFGIRYIVIDLDGNWVFPVDEIIDIRRYRLTESIPPPPAVNEAQISYIKASFRLGDQVVGYLDDELLIRFLKGRLL